MVHKINENSSMLILEGEKDSGNLLIAQYDYGFPRPAYRGRINLIGGAEEKGDVSPYDTMVREVIEEINIDPPKREEFASEKLISELRRQTIANLVHFKDFLSNTLVPPKQGQTKGATYLSIDSVFYSQVGQGLFEDTKEQIQRRKRILTEGNLVAVTLSEIEKGNPLTAWTTGEILEDYFRVEILNPDRVVSVPLKFNSRGEWPHERYREFFEYSK